MGRLEILGEAFIPAHVSAMPWESVAMEYPEQSRREMACFKSK
jgi:hypothetical protein